MSNEGFFQRWSRLKTEPAAPDAAPPPPVVVQAAPVSVDTPDVPSPTLADAAALNGESDYSAFVARDVDAPVRRLAMKTLFADPHFNQVDGLDIFMADFNVPDPVSPAMLAALDHARGTLARIEDLLGGAASQSPTITTAAAAEDTPALPLSPNDNDQEAA
jgi:hypothetical protein